MPDRYAFTSPFGRDDFRGGQPWFRVGDFGFTTTILVLAVSIILLIVRGAEGADHPITSELPLFSGAVQDGDVWRLVTWPFVNVPRFFLLFSFFFFWYFGQQVEALMGRRHYLVYLVLTLLTAALVAVVLDVVADIGGGAFGIQHVSDAALVAFAAQYPRRPFFFGIPAAVFVGVIILLDLLDTAVDENYMGVVIILATVAAGLVYFRSLGYAPELEGFPTVRLPAALTGAGRPSRPATPRQSRRRRSRGRGGLRAVPGPEDGLADMEIDALLDQVAERGLDSLTKEQRKRLEDHSKRLRKKRQDDA